MLHETPMAWDHCIPHVSSSHQSYPRYYETVSNPSNMIGFASEMKSLIGFKNEVPELSIQQFTQEHTHA